MSIRAEEIEGFLSAHERMTTGASFSDGEMFGDWRVTAFLGKGGGGEVYRAVHATLGMVAALKVYVPRADVDVARKEAARTRFVRETAFLAKNAHPAFPRFLGSGERDGRHPGATLSVCGCIREGRAIPSFRQKGNRRVGGFRSPCGACDVGDALANEGGNDAERRG